MKLAEILMAIYDQKPLPIYQVIEKDYEYNDHKFARDERRTKAYREAVALFNTERKQPTLSASASKIAREFGVQPGSAEFNVYVQLLTLVTFMSNNAYINDHFDRKIADASAKLTHLFGDVRKALNYLKKYEATYPQSKDLLSEACDFELPEGKWNKSLWRELAELHLPNSLFGKLFSLADKIESYVQDHEKQIHSTLQTLVAENYRHYLAIEFNKLSHMDETKEAYLETSLRQDKTKTLLNKNLQSTLNVWAREQLGFPNTGKLNEEQLIQLKQFIAENPEKTAPMEFQVIENHKQKLLTEYNKKNHTQDKASFIAERMKKDAKIIAANVKTAADKILSVKTDLKTLSGYAEKVCYKNVELAPDCAKLFFEHGITEEGFEKYLNLIPQDNFEHIPAIFIDGKQLNHDGFYLKRLSSFDPRCAIMGKLTSCCQFILGPGSNYVEHAIESEYAGIYVLCKKSGAKPCEDDLIISQAWSWRGLTNRIVFDSIETHKNFSEKFNVVIYDLFTALAHTLVTKYSVPEVNVGIEAHCQTPDSFKCIETHKPEKPVDYSDYDSGDGRDSKRQSVLASYGVSLSAPEAKSILPRDSKEYSEMIANYSIEGIIKNNNLPLLKKLVKLGFKKVIPYKDDEEKQSSLILLAAKYADAEMTKFLIDNKELSEKSVKAWEHEILRYAAQGKDTKVLQYLLEEKCALKLGIGCDEELAKETAQNQLNQALSNAIEKNNVEAAKLLIENKANVKDVIINGNLVFDNHYEMTKLVFANGVKFDSNFRIDLVIERGYKRMAKLLFDNFPELDKHYLLQLAINTEDYAEIKALVELGLDINRMPYLNLAVITNNQVIFDYLIAKGANLESSPAALNNAIFNNNMRMVKILIAMGADAKKVSLTRAIQYGNITLIQYFSELKIEFSRADILSAANYNQLDILKMMVKDLVIPKYYSYFSDNPLYVIIEYAINNKNFDMVDFIAESYQIDSVILNRTLSLAVRANNFPIIKLLVEKKADIHKSECGWGFPINDAARKCDLDVVQFLVDKKTDINVVCFLSSPLDHAFESGHDDVAKYLIDKGAEPAMDFNNCFKEAIIQNNLKLLGLLFEKRVDVNSQLGNYYSSMTALAYACGGDGWVKVPDVILYLIHQKADVNLGNNGYKPLQIAAKRSDLSLTKLLVENGADVDMSHYEKGASPLELAAQPSYHKYKLHSSTVYEYLLSHMKVNRMNTQGVVFFKNCKAKEIYAADLLKAKAQQEAELASQVKPRLCWLDSQLINKFKNSFFNFTFQQKLLSSNGQLVDGNRKKPF